MNPPQDAYKKEVDKVLPNLLTYTYEQWEQAKKDVASLIEKEAVKADKLARIDELSHIYYTFPTPRLTNKNGKLRPFSLKEVWEYPQVYIKAEANYKNKIYTIIKDRIKELEARLSELSS